MDFNRIRELSGVVSARPSLFEGDDEIGKTIAQQMGGPGRLRIMLGAKEVVLLPNGLRFKWPNKERSLGNVCVITLRGDDTYDMEFLNGAKSVKKFEGIYADALVSTFEQQTGWYLSMSGPRLKRPTQGEAVGGIVKAGCECEGQAGCECEDTSRADMEKALWKWWPPDSKSTTGGTKKVMFTGTMAKAAGVLNFTTMPFSDLNDKDLKACYALLPKKESVDEAKRGKKSNDDWDGREVTVGTSTPPHAVTPRLLGKQVDKFKKMMGVCLADGCVKIQGHSGGHTAQEALDFDDAPSPGHRQSTEAKLPTYAQAQQDILAGLAKEGWTVKLGLKIPQAVSPDASWKLFFKAQAIYLGQGAQADLGSARSLHLNDIRGGTYEKFKADLARWTKAESVEVSTEFRERAGLAGAHANWTLSEGVETFAGIWRRKHIGDESVRVTFKREANKHGIPGVRWSISTDGGLLGSADEADMKDLAKGTAVRMRDGSLSFEGEGLKKFKAWQSTAVQTSFRERAGLAGAHANWTLPTEEEKDSGFECMECGKKFKTVKAAEKAQENGCPKCGGSDIDLASPKKG